MLLGILTIFLLSGAQCTDEKSQTGDKLFVLTVATKENNSFRKFLRSVEVNGMTVKALGMGQKWLALGQKVYWLRDELEHHKDDPDKIILFADAYDVLFNGGVDQILEKFRKFNARVVFSAENNCSPDKSLCPLYPPVSVGKRFLNCGLFIGYAPDIYRVVSYPPYPVEENDQRYFTRVFLDDKLRSELNMKLDHLSQLFQNAEGGENNIQIRFEGNGSFLYNVDRGTQPLILHTPGYCKYIFKYVGNYIPKIWKPEGGCSACLEDTIDLTRIKLADYPTVLIGVFIDDSVSVGKFMTLLRRLAYPKDKIDLFIYDESDRHEPLINNFVNKYGNKYRSIRLATDETNPDGLAPKDMAIEMCVKNKCEYYLNLDSVALLDNADTLRLLIEQNRHVVAPMLFGNEKGQRNFRGIVKNEYRNCMDSVEIVKENDRGLWHVGLIASCYLIRGDVIHNPETKPVYVERDLFQADISLSERLDLNEIDLLASNRFDFGSLDDYNDLPPEPSCSKNTMQFWH